MMVEVPENQAAPDLSKIPIVWPIVVAVTMFGSAVWAGGEVAKAEIAQLKLDSITAKGRLVKAKIFVPPGAVVTSDMLEEVDTFANRVEPYCINKAASAIGKKAKFGLETGQALTVKDLE